MTLKTHSTSSAILAVSVYTLSNSWVMTLAAFLSGIFIDLDHMIDFFIFSGEKLSLKNLFGWCHSRWERSIFTFHSYELYLLAFTFNLYFPNPILTGVLLGTGLHLLLDQIGNRYCLETVAIHPLFYFTSYRAARSFRKDLLLGKKQARDKNKSGL
jgi:membrane-bound metal-dependent hydrolase YbcI (DUF457 family)